MNSMKYIFGVCFATSILACTKIPEQANAEPEPTVLPNKTVEPRADRSPPSNDGEAPASTPSPAKSVNIGGGGEPFEAIDVPPAFIYKSRVKPKNPNVDSKTGEEDIDRRDKKDIGSNEKFLSDMNNREFGNGQFPRR